jgi:hypothetical protein
MLGGSAVAQISPAFAFELRGLIVGVGLTLWATGVFQSLRLAPTLIVMMRHH